MRRRTIIGLAAAVAAAVAVAVALNWVPSGPSYDMGRFPASCGVEPQLLAVGDVSDDFLNGTDDRQEIDGRHPPWSAIGILTSPRTSCSATLIGGYMAVTALHCVMADEINPFPPEAITVAWGVAENGDPARARATALHVQENVDLPVGVPVSIRDVVILSLDRSLGDRFGTIPVAPEAFPIALGLRVDLAGYAFGQASTSGEGAPLRRHAGCTIGALDGGLFASDCDVVAGSSGSPLVHHGPNGPVLVGITTNVLCRPEGGALGAGGLTSTELWRSFPRLLGRVAAAPE